MRTKFIITLLIVSIKMISLNIAGHVVDSAGEPIENVIITINNKAVISTKNGNFRLADVSTKDRVNFHKISFKDKTLLAGEIAEIVILKDDIITIQGLRVIEQRKRELIGSSEIILIKAGNSSGSAADILRENTDLQISGIPLTGEEQKIIFPGYKARHTLVMLDGIPLNKSGTAFDISTIPAEIIESIEVVRGSSSSIGGAGSMGGIININTKQANSKYMASASHTFGSFGLDKHSLTLSAANSKIQFYAFIRKSFARNDFEYTPIEDPDTLRTRDYNDKSIYDANINLGYYGSIGMLSYKLLFQDFFKKLPGNTESLEWFKDSRLTGQSQKHIVNYSKKLRDYSIKADLFYSLDNSLYDNTRLDSTWSHNIFLATLARNRQLSRGIKLHSEYLSDVFYIDWGGDYRYEDFKYTDLNYPDQSIEKVYRNNYAVFGKTQLKQKHFPYTTGLTGSARWDNTTDFNDHTSWKLEPEFSYEKYFKIILGGNVANGYTLPSYYSLFWKGDSHVSGNPDLKPESSLSWQIFSKLKLSDNSFKVTYRHDDIDDMIYWDRDQNGKWKPDNIGESKVTSWEVKTEIYPFKLLRLSCVYADVTAIDITKNSLYEGKDIIYIPDYSLKCDATFEYQDFIVTTSYHSTGEQWTTRDQLSEEKKLPSYDLLNAGIEYTVKWKKIEFKPSIRVNNILNKLYEIYDYVPQPGFNWEVSLRLEYKV